MGYAGVAAGCRRGSDWRPAVGQKSTYKVLSLSLTYKTLQSQKPSYVYNLLNLQANTSSRSSTVITLQRPPVNSHLKISNRSFTYHVPALLNSLPIKTFAILYLTRHLPIYHTKRLITFSLFPHLSFTPNLRLISSTNHSRLSLLALLHIWLSGSLNLWYSHHISEITIILPV